jgi:hypothetical protein
MVSPMIARVPVAPETMLLHRTSSLGSRGSTGGTVCAQAACSGVRDHRN